MANQMLGSAPIEIFDAFKMFTQFRQHGVLHLPALQSRGVRDSMKGNHRILWNKELWVFRFERQLYLLPQQELRVRHFVSHLDKVLNSEVGDCIRIDFSRLLELGEDAFPIRTVAIEQFQEHRAIFESAIDSLPKERNDRVCGVAKQ